MIFSKLNGTAYFRNDNGVERIPCADDIALLYLLAILSLSRERAVRNVVGNEKTVGSSIYDTHLAGTADDYNLLVRSLRHYK